MNREEECREKEVEEKKRKINARNKKVNKVRNRIKWTQICCKRQRERERNYEHESSIMRTSMREVHIVFANSFPLAES